MIKFVTGFSGFGGSTIMTVQHCKLLKSKGYEVEFYGAEDWHLDKFEGSKLIGELHYDHDDIIIYHYFSPEKRPNCKKCFLYIQETNLFDLRTKDLSTFDDILFVSECQIRYHGREKGLVMPNRMSGLVDSSKNNPPEKNIAGIVGHIHPIKQPHVALKKALEDGVSKVLMYGQICGPYFDAEIKPLLSEKVAYAGIQPPESRMDMYNSFDVLYHFGEYESACLTWGEAKMLGKKIVKSDLLCEYPILSDDEVFEHWKRIID